MFQTIWCLCGHILCTCVDGFCQYTIYWEFFVWVKFSLSGFNLNSQIPVSNSQLVFPTSEVFNIAALYGYSFLGWELGSSFSPPLAENDTFFLLLFKEMCYFFRHHCHMARQRVCVMRRFDFSTAFTVDSLKHLWDQDRDFVLYEISNSQLFSSAYILNSQNWISTRILRVCKREFRAL